MTIPQLLRGGYIVHSNIRATNFYLISEGIKLAFGDFHSVCRAARARGLLCH